MKDIYPEILGKNQALILPRFSFLKKKGFYLAGGTALALQVGHRSSVDFDFYNPQKFDIKELYDEIEKVFGKKTQKTLQEKDTLFCTINDKVGVSFFYYDYSLIKKPRVVKGILLASIEDIAAMKLIAISQRPLKRDYIDIFFILKIFSLKKIFSFAKKKYPRFNEYYVLRALTYFEDIKDEGERAIKILAKNFSWEKAKKKIFEEVKDYQMVMI